MTSFFQQSTFSLVKNVYAPKNSDIPSLKSELELIFGSQITPPISEILCVKNVRAIVVCGFLIKYLKKYVYWKYGKNCGSRLGVAC